MFTEKQLAAINFDQGNLLVSASAGSGKTCVMVNRILRLILEGKANVDEILCVTFTVLAATEMKQKIANAITEEMKKVGPEERLRLAKQLDLLPMANISTVHSFCNNLIKEFFYEAGVDPSFSVVSDAERERLVKRAIDGYFDDLYESEDEILGILLPVFFRKRSDGFLKDKIREVYRVIMTEVDPFSVLDNGEKYYTEQGLELIYAELCADLKSEIKAFADYIESSSAIFVGYADFENYIAQMLNGLNAAADGKSCAEIIESLAELKLRRPSKKKTEDANVLKAEAALERVAKKYQDFRTKKIKEYDLNDLETERVYAADGLKVYRAFITAVKGFAKAFEQVKRDENCVDFSDFEHLAVKILKNDAVRNEVRSRFKYVFTDEYQDTSGVQEFILSAVSDNNLFMVGDVKQNIYDFRGCNPQIFADKREKFETTGEGTVIDLDKNFRSTNAVISSVNCVFSGSMTIKCGNVDYAANPMIFGADYPPDNGIAEIHLVKKNASENCLPDGVYGVVKHLEKMNDGECFAEGAYIAKLIDGLRGKEIYIGKNGEKRKIELKDFAILLRNANAVGDAYAKELIAYGIPVSANSKNSIGEYAEIAFLIDLLKLIGCFNLDIPLASVLKSPIGGLNDAELFSVRKFTPKGSFVDAYRTYIREKTDELSDKLKRFDEYMNKVRLMAEFMPCDELLSKIIRDKQLDVNWLASRMGEFKMNRVNAFIRAAGSKKQTVDEFLAGVDETVKQLTIAYDDENAVKIMSVHASKGLEYPVVILAGGLKVYNDRDKSGNFICDRKYGVAIAHYDLDKMTVDKTAFLMFLKKKLLKRSREEEMRILYVALTRARNNLYVVGEYPDVCPELKYGHFEGDIYSVRRPLDFFSDGDLPLFDEGEMVEREQETKSVRQVLISEYDEKLSEFIAANLDFEYSTSDVGLAVKRSVTSAVHFKEDDSPDYEKNAIVPDEPCLGSEELLSFDAAPIDFDDVKAKGISREKREDIGTAYHAFLEKCNFENDAESEINRLIDGHMLKEEYIPLLRKYKLKQILNMDIFKSIKGMALYREQPFTAYMPQSLFEDEYEGNGEVLVQGIIDLLCIDGDNATIIDYKFTSEKDEEVLISRYKKQLELYAYAVENVLHKKVVGSYIVNILANKVIAVPLASR